MSEASYRCPQCGGDLELVDDSGRGDGMQPTPWFTWHCGPCQWEAGWAGTPELADRQLERKVKEAWKGYERAPYLWVGPVLITWMRPAFGDRWLRDYMLPREIRVAWNPD